MPKHGGTGSWSRNISAIFIIQLFCHHHMQAELESMLNESKRVCLATGLAEKALVESRLDMAQHLAEVCKFRTYFLCANCVSDTSFDLEVGDG